MPRKCSRNELHTFKPYWVAVYLERNKNYIWPLDKHIYKQQNNDPTLQVLILDEKNIGNDGAACLADALAKNSTLQMLFLSENKFGDQGAECPASFVSQFLSLSTASSLLTLLHSFQSFLSVPSHFNQANSTCTPSNPKMHSFEVIVATNNKCSDFLLSA